MRIEVYSHRGRPGPENTVSAFRNAVKLGVDGIETDVQGLALGELVLFHDPDIYRTTNATPLTHPGLRGQLHTLSAEEVRKLDAGSWFGEDFVGEKIPFVPQVLEEFAGQIKFIFEIKAREENDDTSSAESLLRLCADHRNTVMFSCFDFATVLRLKALDKKATVGFLIEESLPDNLEKDLARNDIDEIHPQAKVVFENPGVIAQWKSLGIRTVPWDVSVEEMDRMIDLAPDGMIVDRPDVLLQKLGRSASSTTETARHF